MVVVLLGGLALVGMGSTAAPRASTGDPVILAAGDIACPASEPVTATTCNQKQTSDLLVASNAAAVLPLGDNQYESGVLADYLASYDPTWGRVKSITHPTPGNHEYMTAGAQGYFTYFGGSAGDGYYSFNVGAWHIISLDSEIPVAAGSPQERWLKKDLNSDRAACTLAYWHKPRFSSGVNGNYADYATLWKDLYAAHADVVLNGHDHDYERFAPQNPSQQADPKGITEFVVGTGGFSHFSRASNQPNSVVFNSDTFGVLELTLHPTGYDWKFIPEAGGTFRDSGSGSCH